MNDSFLFTGTGGSMGVPVIGCECAVCLSPVKENKRYRTAGFLRAGGKQIAVDMGPEFRLQCLSFGIKSIDGVIITHSHADHINGVDDVRVFHFQNKMPVPCLLNDVATADIENRFHYFFPPFHGDISQSQKLKLHVIDKDFGDVEFLGLPLKVMTYHQAGMKIMGFRYKNFAYITDIQTFTDEIFSQLHGVETLVLSALRWTPSLVHFTIDDALNFIDKCGAERALFTHVSHDLDHFETEKKLPAHVRLAYDGLEVPIG